jgi:hypothetical protein
MELKHPLTIRAGDGFRPVIVDTRQDPAPDVENLLWARSSLRLEGIVLRSETKSYRTLFAEGPLAVANCRFWKQSPGLCIGTVTECNVRNCEVSSPLGAAAAFEKYGTDVVVANCLLIGHNNLDDRDVNCGATVRFLDNTFLTADASKTAFLYLMYMSRVQTTQVAPEHLRIFTSENVFASEQFTFELIQSPELAPALLVDEAETWLTRRVQWREERNLYPPRNRLLGIGIVVSSKESRVFDASRGMDLVDWNKLWSLEDTGSSQGNIRFQGGDLHAKAKLNAAALTPEDFRLRPDSAGYRAGSDGKDLGADVDLVGPGPAYERWKKMPEYQEWLMETGQMK